MTSDLALTQSIRQRLDNLARKNGEDVQRNLVRYAIERLLYRLSVSPYRERFILKGAMLFSAWDQAPYRATGDLDLLGSGDNAEASMIAVIRDICAIVPVASDGLVFDTAGIQTEPLRLATEYAGVALRFDALLGRARLRMQVDIGIGDAVTPAPREIVFPTLLDMPPPRLLAYPPETVIAEKLEAIVSLGLATTRIKDFFDIWAIAQSFDLDGAILATAIKATFARRATPLPTSPPPALTRAFADDQTKQRLWTAFSRDRIDAAASPPTLRALHEAINLFIDPLIAAQFGPSVGVWDHSRQQWRRQL